jgi:2-desacetyl-2-hydroxyethyl bacteriochlorophyllide A dehydrogenase
MQTAWTVPAHTLHHLPANLSMLHAALIEPLSVACHDVRMGAVADGENVVVMGGGPIGTLIALVARSRGGKVLVAEINPHRLKLLQDLGFETMDPQQKGVPELVMERTGGAGADVLFEVSGAPAAAELMTNLMRTRGRIVVVAIYPEPARIDLFRFFWRELKLCGARVYEDQDFEAAIQMAASGSLPLDRLITHTLPMEQIESGFKVMESGGAVMKVLISCGD